MDITLCKIVLDKEQCFCPLRCKSIVPIIVYLSSTRQKPLRRNICRWSTEIMLSRFCQSRKLLLVLCPPCVAVTSMEFQMWLREYLSISTSDLKSVGLVPASSRISEKLFHKLVHGRFGERFLSSPAFSCFTQFLLFLQHLSGSSSFTGPLKNLSLKRGSSSVAITRHLLFTMSENLLYKEASISDFTVCTPLSS